MNYQQNLSVNEKTIPRHPSNSIKKNEVYLDQGGVILRAMGHMNLEEKI
jgi:hypothetical protein